MLKGDYKCPYCGDICNEQGIKGHIMKAHPLHFEEFGYDHLNKFPIGHEKHSEETERLIDIIYSKENTPKTDELASKEEELKIKKSRQKTENAFKKQEEEKDKERLTKDDILGVTQTPQTAPQETIIVYACQECNAEVKENMQVCPNCGTQLNWQGVE